ncbi:hypothetical protein ID875_25625 [Streptomyces globisporus]|uniref:Uncharacterized protein n=1 Tax=Streptomyces globisporus TaxID=1908 RepID=A0A927GPB8_STRGL|nr:hypothetical protein [Streptomyces globisporus]
MVRGDRFSCLGASASNTVGQVEQDASDGVIAGTKVLYKSGRVRESVHDGCHRVVEVLARARCLQGVGRGEQHAFAHVGGFETTAKRVRIACQ